MLRHACGYALANGVLARIDAALTELGHDPQNLTPEILATLMAAGERG